MMKKNLMPLQQGPRWLWIEWSVATLIGYTLGILVILPWMVQLAYAARPGLLSGLAGGAVLGGVVGGAQWLILRRHIRGIGGWWVLASIAGGMLGLALGMALVDIAVLPAATGTVRGSATPMIPLRAAFQTALIGVMVGVVLGGIQWLALRRVLPTAGWWVLASGLGWMVGMGLGAAIAENVGVIGALLVTGAISGVTTGFALQNLVWQETP